METAPWSDRRAHRLRFSVTEMSWAALMRLFSWMHAMFRRLMCLVRGHNLVLHFEPKRLALRCLDCPYQSPGWIVGDRIPGRVLPRVSPDTLRANDRAA